MPDKHKFTDKEEAIYHQRVDDEVYPDGKGEPIRHAKSDKPNFKTNPLTWIMPIVAFLLLLPLLVFHLGGNDHDASEDSASEETADTTEESSEESSEEATASDFDAEGFARSNCASCHGEDYTGAMGPQVAGLDTETISSAVREGPGSMPAFTEEQIGNEDLEALASYLSEQ